MDLKRLLNCTSTPRFLHCVFIVYINIGISRHGLEGKVKESCWCLFSEGCFFCFKEKLKQKQKATEEITELSKCDLYASQLSRVKYQTGLGWVKPVIIKMFLLAKLQFPSHISIVNVSELQQQTVGLSGNLEFLMSTGGHITDSWDCSL